MPFVTVKLIEGVFTPEQKQRIVRDLTDAGPIERPDLVEAASGAQGAEQLECITSQAPQRAARNPPPTPGLRPALWVCQD